MTQRKKIVAVVGTAAGPSPAAAEVGKALAALNVHLLTGGGPGAMRDASESFRANAPADRLVLGIIPKEKPGYPNDFVDVVIRTHLTGVDPMGHDSRNHINAMTADAMIAVAGGKGTHAEINLARRLYGKRVFIYLKGGEKIGDDDDAALRAAGFDCFSNLEQFIATLKEVLGV